MAAIQDQLHGSFLIRFMVQYSPLTTGLLKQLWVVKILSAYLIMCKFMRDIIERKEGSG